METDNITWVLARFINELKIPVTYQTIDEQLQIHPNFGSILAYSDVLNSFRIPNGAYHLSFEQLTKVSLPFITFISSGEFAIVTSFDDNYAILSTKSQKRKKFTANKFKNIYSGSVLIAEKQEDSGESEFYRKRKVELIKKMRLPAFIIGTLLLLTMYTLLHLDALYFNIAAAPLLLLKTIGLATSIMLLIQSIDANNPLIKKLCGDNDKNCNSILSSNAAKITDYLNWSEVGFFYFAGTWLAVLFSSGHIATIQAIAIINLLCLPYTIYSIYYQWKIAKQWCVFCCTVQGVLWLEFVTFLPHLIATIHLQNLREWNSLGTYMLIPILAWILLKSYLFQLKQIQPLKKQLRLFKYNSELFDKVMNSGPKYALLKEEHSIIIGNQKAEKVITMVSNPFCQPCAKAHKSLQWLDNRPDIKLQILFTTPDNESSNKTIVASHFLSMKNQGNDTMLKKAMHEWYEKKNYSALTKLYPISKSSMVKEQLERQREWCKISGVASTPTFFLNGRKLPIDYEGGDLKYFI